ncbi:MAG: methyltransferase domain-containing protein [Bacteroidales bacterium]|nr:methyltransferase domain-containing protein [Bacteroidales bacterium]
MYITKSITGDIGENFNWNEYFSSKSMPSDSPSQIFDIIQAVKKHLKEGGFNMTIAMNRVMNILLKDIKIHEPKVLELGAATGFFTKWIISKYGGKGLLIDNNYSSYEAFCKDSKVIQDLISYKVEDIFKLKLEEQFDITCSFGLIEHFVDKKEVLDVHKKYLKNDALSIIIVPLDSPLTRTFFEVHPELNLGYRELLTESEFTSILSCNGFQVINTAITSGYVYDFIAAACKANN